jgi:hypothetical protein
VRKLAPLLATVVLLAVGCSSGRGSGSGRTTVTTTTGGSPVGARTTPRTADAYVKELAAGLAAGSGQNTHLVFRAKEAACVAPRWVRIIGVRTLQAKRVSPSDLGAAGFDFSTLGLAQRQAAAMIDASDGCKVETVKEFRSVLEGRVDATKQACLRTQLTDATARQLFEQSLYRAQPSDDLKTKLDAIGLTCGLTAGGTSGNKTDAGSTPPPPTAGSPSTPGG